MPLIRDAGFVIDTWMRIDLEAPFPPHGEVIVPFERIDELAAAWPNDCRIGIQVGNAVSLQALRPHLPRLALVSIAFPSFSDGRGFSLAKTLRIEGFAGRIRAFGPLIADQYVHALACGFDEIEIPDAVAARQPEAQWRAALSSMSVAYQRGYRGATNILDRRHAAIAPVTAMAEVLCTLNSRADTLDVPERLGLARQTIPGRFVFTTSFGLEDQALTHAIFKDGLDIDVVTLDTGRLFAETHALWAETERRYGQRIKAFYPRPEAVEQYVAAEGIDGFYGSVAARRRCCHIRKVEPLSCALVGAAAWVTGLRAGQSAERADIRFAELDVQHDLLKLNPLFDWSSADLAAFIARETISHSALHARGFASIGCSPCTRAIRPGEPERAGRWWWETEGKKECGLHLGVDGSFQRGAATVRQPEGEFAS
jgi:phosphoadenosine phosphosulfate reductase